MTDMTLNLGKIEKSNSTFRLPLAAVTSTIALLARKGRGKSYLGAVIAEEMLEAGQVPIIIDPTSAHWGLKSSADGKSVGYPVVIFGGDHGDVPLEETAGEIVARAIVEQRFPAILDLSLFRKGQTYRFLAQFLETLYRLNREAVHIIADEADYYAPQQPHGDQARVLGAMEDIVRRGRIKGIGCTMITQRPQVLNKNVLTQADMLVAMGMNHPRDIGAIEEWVAVHGDEKKSALMIASLPGLPIGTAWFWAPALDDTFDVVKVRERRTFDSSATPKPGEKVTAPKKLAEIDVAKLGETIAATVQRAKENDPAELKREIPGLKKQLASQPAPAPVIKEVKVPDTEALNQLNGRLNVLDVNLREIQGDIAARLKEIERFRQEIEPLTQEIRRQLTSKLVRTIQLRSDRDIKLIYRSPTERIETELTGAPNGTLPKGERTILTVCAQYPAGATREQLTILTGYKRSSRDTYLQRLREKGYVDDTGGLLQPTEAGVKALGHFEALPTGSALLDHWLNRLPEGERRILEIVAGAEGKPVEREFIDGATGYQRSSRDTYLQRLGARRLVVQSGRGEVRAAEELFD